MTENHIRVNELVIIHLTSRLRGMIRTFNTSHDDSDPLVDFLMSHVNGELPSFLSDDVQQSLQQKVEDEYADPTIEPHIWTDNKILGKDLLDLLSTFVDHVWERHKHDETQKDMRIIIEPWFLCCLLTQALRSFPTMYIC